MIIHSMLWFDHIQSVSIRLCMCMYACSIDLYTFEESVYFFSFQIKLKFKKNTLMNVYVHTYKYIVQMLSVVRSIR